MSLTFLNPLILAGLAAAILPILIHRLTHRKALRKNFSAVRLLVHSRNLMARPQRLKHLILLALRVMAVAALVVIAARPMLVRPGLLAMGEGGAKVLILDNSASMGYRDAQGQRFARAKRATQEIVGLLSKPTAEVLIIPTAPIQGRLPDESELRWMRSAEVARYLTSLPLSTGKGEPGAALALALKKLSSVKGAREIILISDMAKGDWQGSDLGKLGTLPANTQATFLRIGGKTRDSNMAVKAIRLKEGDLVAGTSCRLEATIANLSDQPSSTVVQVMMGNTKVSQSTLELKPREDGKIYFDLLLDRPGSINGRVRLSGDNLPYDDLLDFTLKVREKIRVLVVDGDPRGSMRASESYYLSHALQPGNTEGSPFQTKVISEKEFSEVNLKSYDALFLLNVAKPQPSKIAAFLDAGNPVFIFLGDRILPDEYNSIPLFSWRLREIREATAQRPERITTVDYGHEALKQFSEAGRESLEGAAFRRYFKIDSKGQARGNLSSEHGEREGKAPEALPREGATRAPRISVATKTLLALENKDPLLLESPFGKGKILLYTSSADADWNDLPLKAAYVPLLQGILKEAVGLARGTGLADKGLGEPAIPPQESDLGKLDNDDVTKEFSGMDVQIKEYSEGVSSQMSGSRKELWTYLLGFLLLVLVIETGIANRL